jgi:hypothetical protein
MTWVERETSWHRTEVAYCEVTGQLLPRRYWEFADGERTIKARDPHSEELYWRYIRGVPRPPGAGTTETPAGDSRAALPGG